MSLPHNAVGWSAAQDCGISCSYSLTFGLPSFSGSFSVEVVLFPLIYCESVVIQLFMYFRNVCRFQSPSLLIFFEPHMQMTASAAYNSDYTKTHCFRFLSFLLNLESL